MPKRKVMKSFLFKQIGKESGLFNDFLDSYIFVRVDYNPYYGNIFERGDYKCKTKD